MSGGCVGSRAGGTGSAPILTSPPAEDIAWLRLRLTPEQKAHLAEAARASGEDLNTFSVARLMASVGPEREARS